MLSLLVLAVQLFGPRPNGQRLREPTKDEYSNVGVPLGRIVARHIPSMESRLAKDIADGSRAVDGIKDYLRAEPFGGKERLEDA